jgi:hypothetical protein
MRAGADDALGVRLMDPGTRPDYGTCAAEMSRDFTAVSVRSDRFRERVHRATLVRLMLERPFH